MRESLRGLLELSLWVHAEESGEPEEDAADVGADECVVATGRCRGHRARARGGGRDLQSCGGLLLGGERAGDADSMRFELYL